MSIVFCIIFALAAIYAISLIVAYFFAELFIFRKVPLSYALSANDVFIDLPDGNKILGRYYAKNAATRCILYSHGNGEDVGMIDDVLRKYVSCGYCVLAYDYVGYGLSTGSASVSSLMESADAAWNYAHQTLGFAPENIVPIGYSLGSVAACSMIKNHPDVRCAIIVGGISEGVKTFLPVNIVPWDILNNAKIISQTSVPILFMHGDADLIVNARNARENFAVCKSPKKIVWFNGMGHYHLADTEKYWHEIKAFIENPKSELKK